MEDLVKIIERESRRLVASFGAAGGGGGAVGMGGYFMGPSFTFTKRKSSGGERGGGAQQCECT